MLKSTCYHAHTLPHCSHNVYDILHLIHFTTLFSRSMKTAKRERERSALALKCNKRYCIFIQPTGNLYSACNLFICVYRRIGWLLDKIPCSFSPSRSHSFPLYLQHPTQNYKQLRIVLFTFKLQQQQQQQTASEERKKHNSYR